MISTRNAGLFQCRSLFPPSRLVSSKKEVKISNKRTWIEHVADVRSPHLWYPAARALTPRVITCHVGPTNSGKTYAALQALKRSRTGIYCGPLRLLAWEVTEILRNSEFGDSGDSIACSLITGQEKDIAPGATHVSCTVEMTNLGDDFDCAVIDEMQLIGDRERGWAWTQALLGLRCRNIHVCGNATFLPLLRQICADTGDELVVHEYQRMSPLTPATVALGSYSDIAPGDCVIGFSRSKLYQIKASVERELNRNVVKHYRKDGDCGSTSSPPIETKCCVI
jgi:ATP-dependent RNA helicase SUPV3L1/SUV3